MLRVISSAELGRARIGVADLSAPELAACELYR
jgi:hypothetical protein